VFAFSLNYDVLQFLLSATSRRSDKTEGLVSEGRRFNSAQGEETCRSTDCFLLDADSTVLLFIAQGEALFSRLKQSEGDTEHSPSSNVEVGKN
jgi:hypothetical protein